MLINTSYAMKKNSFVKEIFGWSQVPARYTFLHRKKLKKIAKLWFSALLLPHNSNISNWVLEFIYYQLFDSSRHVGYKSWGFFVSSGYWGSKGPLFLIQPMFIPYLKWQNNNHLVYTTNTDKIDSYMKCSNDNRPTR